MNLNILCNKNFSKYAFIILIFNLFGYNFSAQNSQPHPPLSWHKDGITITLDEHLQIPEMSWPETLLEYPTDFSGEPVLENELRLTDVYSKTDVPFQLTNIKYINGRVESAVLCFMSDLPPGTQRQWKLEKFAPSKKYQKPAPPRSLVFFEDKAIISVDNGNVKTEIFKPENGVSRTVFRVGTNDRPLGKFVLPDHAAVLDVEIIEKEKGALLAEYLIRYTFSNNRSYRLKLRTTANMEFIEMEEEMTGFTEQDSLTARLLWDRFDPDHRYAPNRNVPIDVQKGKGYANYNWEKITGNKGDPNSLDVPDMMPWDREDSPEGRFPFKITPFHNWSTRWRSHTAAFWKEQTGQSVGLFIKDFENWVDPAYPLWGSKDNLSIHFYYVDQQLQWRFPLVTGKRSLAVAIYPHRKNVEAVERYNLVVMHIDYLRRWYGWISLNKTRHWILDYKPAVPNHPAFFKSKWQEVQYNPDALFPSLTEPIIQVANGTERHVGISPATQRTFHQYTTALFEHAESSLTIDEYRRARALYLFTTYVSMDEALMPIMNMLSGHPNFFADVKAVPGLAVFLFPDHPQAKEMADHFEKATALNLRYHTRPDEPAWDAKGGRWTENLGCYTWLFLTPSVETSFLLHHLYDGKNRILQPNIDLYADWMLNSMAAPLDSEGKKRVFPPQGAHSNISLPWIALHMLGHELRYYDPLLSERLLWVTSSNDPSLFLSLIRCDGQFPWDGPAKALYRPNDGTNPHLASAKYTGYGLILRSDFGKPEEMYVHLQQIDPGPNYRWGRAGRGGNGVIYYYAGGKRYSHNGMEDVGDGYFGDTERCTNFGVKKEKSYRNVGDYRCVGQNELTEPLYDFGFAQFASVLANREAAPEYRSRSVLMSGNNYILILDDLKDDTVEGRLSWFVGNDDDFPSIHQLTPGVQYVDANIQPIVLPGTRGTETLATKGRYYDGKGDFLTLVTHKASVKPVPDGGAYQIAMPDGSTEWVVRSDQTTRLDKKQFLFEGQAGLIRQGKDGMSFEAALFQGEKIGVPGLVVEWATISKQGGIALKKNDSGYAGIIQLQEENTVRFTVREKLPSGMVFYLDGRAIDPVPSGKDVYTLTVPAGKHHWQWTDKGVTPQAPVIDRSVAGATYCVIGWTPVPGAEVYRIQKSVDGGNTWETVAENVQGIQTRLSGLTAGVKIHVRVIAVGAGGASAPSSDYPVYPDADKPHAPEGLRAINTGCNAELTWGQILGVDQYVLYQRKKGTTDFQKVYTGDQRKVVLPLPDSAIYEYAVTAVNDNGESDKSFIADTDPYRLINWYPVPGEIFRRDTESHENGIFEVNHWIEQKMPVLKYPFQLK